MLIVMVSVHVKPEYVEAFRAATIANATASVKEKGIDDIQKHLRVMIVQVNLVVAKGCPHTLDTGGCLERGEQR